MVRNEGYRHTLRIYNTYYFSTATVVTRTRLNVTLILTIPVLFFLSYKQEDKNVLAHNLVRPRADHTLITTGPTVAAGIIGLERLTPCHCLYCCHFPLRDRNYCSRGISLRTGSRTAHPNLIRLYSPFLLSHDSVTAVLMTQSIEC
jgi:hypothetical protein